MSTKLFGYKKADFIGGVEFAGAATYCEETIDSYSSSLYVIFINRYNCENAAVAEPNSRCFYWYVSC